MLGDVTENKVESGDSDSDEVTLEETLFVIHKTSKVNYTLPVDAAQQLSSPFAVLDQIPSLAFDNSLGQIRSRGAEANHLGVQIDGYDIGDPVSDFNFATLSCVGVAQVNFNPTPASGSIAGTINFQSNTEKRNAVSLAHGSAGQLMLVDLARPNHNLSLSTKEWVGVDVRQDGDIDGLTHDVIHYHSRTKLGSTTIRFGRSEQHYDRGTAHIEQALVGFTGSINDQVEIKLSTSINRAEWVESFNNNTYGSRTKLTLSIPLLEEAAINFAKTYDVNKSYVRGVATRKPINVTYGELIYGRQFSQVQVHGSVAYTDSSQDDAVISSKLHLARPFIQVANFLSHLTLYAEMNYDTIVFPSMIDRYGWGAAWLPNPEVKPERGSGVDIGFFLVGKSFGTLQITSYRNRLTDKIAFGRNVSENAVYGRNQGLEVVWKRRWLKEFNRQLSTNISYSKVDSETRATPSTPYHQTQRRPARILAGLIQYDGTDRFPLVGSVDFRWVDESIDACWSGCKTLDAFLLVNTRFSYTIGELVEVSASVYNLFDTEYNLAYGYSSPARQYSIGINVPLD